MNDVTPADKMRTIMYVIYGCWAGGLLGNIIHPLGILPLIGLIIALIKRKEMVGTLYESHCTWVIRTFVIGIIAALACMALMIIPPIAMIGFLALSLWGLWRLVKGGLRLYEKKPVENPQAFI